MTGWFRVDERIFQNRKIARLSAEAFRVLVCIWALTKQNARCGKKTTVEDLEWELRGQENCVGDIVAKLKKTGLITDELYPHDWEEHQYKNEAGERVEGHRDRKKKEAQKLKEYEASKRNGNAQPLQCNATVTDGNDYETGKGYAVTNQSQSQSQSQSKPPTLLSQTAPKKSQAPASGEYSRDGCAVKLITHLMAAHRAIGPHEPIDDKAVMKACIDIIETAPDPTAESERIQAAHAAALANWNGESLAGWLVNRRWEA